MRSRLPIFPRSIVRFTMQACPRCRLNRIPNSRSPARTKNRGRGIEDSGGHIGCAQENGGAPSDMCKILQTFCTFHVCVKLNCQICVTNRSDWQQSRYNPAAWHSRSKRKSQRLLSLVLQCGNAATISIKQTDYKEKREEIKDEGSYPSIRAA